MKVIAFFRLHEVRWAIPEPDLVNLRRRFPAVEIVAIEDETDLPAAVPGADAFLGWHFPRDLFASAKRLRWIQTASAGVEANLFPELVASDVLLTNAAGLHAVSIPEHVLGLMLSLARNLHQAHRLQAQSRWERYTVIAFAGGVRELAGSNLAVLGAGAIGAALTRLAAALGMHVRVMRNRPDRPVAGAEAVVGGSELHALLSWADFVVLATPLTAETRRLIDAEALRQMKSSAYLINIARGEVVDDDALVAALQSQAIAGAGLDVFSEEPLPASSPYWALPNVIVTPHVSGYTPDYFGKVLALFTDNLERFLRGATLRNVVNKQRGYVEE
jgi:phosphoglycerate dehydrogenase-like enzyme